MTIAQDLTVSQLAGEVQNALRRAFPRDFWLVAEVQEFDRNKHAAYAHGQVYFKLVEKDERSDRLRASANAVLWGNERQAIERKLHEFDLAIHDGIRVRLRCRVEFYRERAQLQVKVLDCDPDFTAGQWELRRKLTIKRLHQEGLIERNRQLYLEPLLLRIGLITAAESAAYHDFMEEIRTSRLGFRVLLSSVPVQGSGAASAIAAALRQLASARPRTDAIVLIRGGGSRVDLAPFDDEGIARTIATSPVPVLTGIGHQIDRSVADEVAHRSFKTPTAVAQFIVERARQCENEVEQLFEKIRDHAERALVDQKETLSRTTEGLERSAMQRFSIQQGSLESAASGLRDRATALTRSEVARLDAISGYVRREARSLIVESRKEEARIFLALKREVGQLLRRSQAETEADSRGLTHAVERELGRQSHGLTSAASAIRISSKARIQEAQRALGEAIAITRLAARGSGRTELALLASHAPALQTRARQILLQAKNALDAEGKLVSAYDPTRVLERGYAILEHPSGRAIASVDDVERHDAVRAVLRDGRVLAKVEDIEKGDDDGREERGEPLQLRRVAEATPGDSSRAAEREPKHRRTRPAG